MSAQSVVDKRTVIRRSLFHGLPVAFLVLGLLTYWFGFANRSIVFLYDHDMGLPLTETAPFGRVTASRYWMAGLVASGFVLVLYIGLNWLAGRLRANYLPPPWSVVWLVCLPIFLVAIPLITMGLHMPVLPWYLAAAVTLAAIVGVALALLPGELAARRPWDLLWLAADGWGLALLLLMLAQLDDLGRWLSDGMDWRVSLSLGISIAAIIWLLMLTAARYFIGVTVGDFWSLAASGICVAYLFLPLLHYLVGTDGYFYITDSDNFLAGSLLMQLIAWLLYALVIWALLGFRRRLFKKVSS